MMLRTILNLKSKPLKLSLLAILGFLSFGVFHYNIQLKSVKEMFEPHLSPNPEATEYFIKAMNVSLYIRRLHMFVNYDNPLMKPLFVLQEVYLNEGKALLKNGIAEYIFFWVILNRGTYGISVDIHKDDKSLDVSYLPLPEYKKLNEKLYEMILAYMDLKNDFQYESAYVKAHKFIVAENLLNHFYNRYYFQYEGTGNARAILNLKDPEYTKKVETIYPLYKAYAKIYLPYAEHFKRESIDYKISMTGMVEMIYFSRQYRLRSLQISKEDCEDIKAKDFLENLILLGSERNNTYRRISTSIFNKDKYTYQVTDMLDKSCKNLKDDAQKVLALF